MLHPRFTSVNTPEDVVPTINSRHFDLIIIMAGVDKEMPIRIAELVHTNKPRIPILLLVNNNNDVGYFKRSAALFRPSTGYLSGTVTLMYF